MPRVILFHSQLNISIRILQLYSIFLWPLLDAGAPATAAVDILHIHVNFKSGFE